MTKFFEVVSTTFELLQLLVILALTGVLLVGGFWFAVLMAMITAGQTLPIWLP